MKRPCRLIIVDDHPLFTTVLKDVLNQSEDFTVIGVARGGQEGLELCIQTKPELVLLDLMMPGMSGLELLVRLQQLDSQALLVAISGLTTKEAIHMALSMGACAFVSKSTSIEELLSTLQALRTGAARLSQQEAEALRWAVREQRANKTILPEDLEVLRLFAQGITVKEIADTMGKSSSAIYKTLRKNKRRFEVTSDWDLRLAAMRLGLAECREPNTPS